MSLASVSAQQTTASTAAAGSTTQNPLASLSSNFNNFLGLLMTQLKNQDPTSPLDTNQFTSQLVQFSSVEQQINTNTSLTQLIQLTQASEVMQSSTVLGKQITVQSDHVPLQNGTGQVTFTAPAAEPVAIAIYSDAGVKIRDASLTSAQGANSWTWDGRDNSGGKVADGAYKIAVSGRGSGGATTALPFTVTGTATGVTNQNNSVQLDIGALTVAFSAVQSVGN
jgi:flagellar basal-body rod modification protein FlgD